MATTKTNAAIWSGTSQAAAASTTGSTIDMTNDYELALSARITNGGTGPTIPARIDVQVSHDNSVWFTYGTLVQGGTTSSGVYENSCTLTGWNYARLYSTANTAQAVTLDAAYTLTTAV